MSQEYIFVALNKFRENSKSEQGQIQRYCLSFEIRFKTALALRLDSITTTDDKCRSTEDHSCVSKELTSRLIFDNLGAYRATEDKKIKDKAPFT